MTQTHESKRARIQLRAFLAARAVLVALAALLASCAVPGVETHDDEKAIRALDREMVAALGARDVGRYMRCLAENATWLPPGRPAVTGKPAIRELVSELVAIPDFTVAHHPRTIEVSRSGDLATLWYTYVFTVTDGSGRRVTETGSDLAVLRKTDGAWRVVLDMWTSHPPPSNGPP